MEKKLDSFFSNMVDYINIIEIGKEVRRQDLISQLGGGATLDVYRRHLTLIGVLDDYKNGVYIKKNNVPSFINSSNIKLYAHDADKNSIIKLYYLKEIRKKKIKEIFE
jgi:hypothetical protein